MAHGTEGVIVNDGGMYQSNPGPNTSVSDVRTLPAGATSIVTAQGVAGVSQIGAVSGCVTTGGALSHSCTVTMTADQVVSASFVSVVAATYAGQATTQGPGTGTINASGEGVVVTHSGVGISTQQNPSVAAGTVYTVTASAGSVIDAFGGSCASSGTLTSQSCTTTIGRRQSELCGDLPPRSCRRLPHLGSRARRKRDRHDHQGRRPPV